jgi:hypothetical protein
MSVCCECCVWSSRGYCDGPITRPEECYGGAACLSVIDEPLRGSLGGLEAVKPWRKQLVIKLRR